MINLKELKDEASSKGFKHRAEELLYQAEMKEQEILKIVYEKIG